jgi:hypothetical protein
LVRIPLADLGSTQAGSQAFQLTDQLPYEINGRLIGQPALFIKLCLRVSYVDMRCIYRNHIQRHVVLNFSKLPRERLPTVVDQVCSGIEWVHANISSFGGDPSCSSMSGR